MFLEPIRARFVRLVAYSWHGSISMRLEFLSCWWLVAEKFAMLNFVTAFKAKFCIYNILCHFTAFATSKGSIWGLQGIGTPKLCQNTCLLNIYWYQKKKLAPKLKLSKILCFERSSQRMKPDTLHSYLTSKWKIIKRFSPNQKKIKYAKFNMILVSGYQWPTK